MYSWVLFKPLVFYRVLAAVEHEYVLSLDFETIVDIGANRGQFSLAARLFSPNAIIYAFEPLEGPSNIFHLVFKRDSQVVMKRVAIANEMGQLKMHISRKDDSSSILPISRTQEELYPGTGQIRTQVVEVGPLGCYISNADIKGLALLKIDVQGYEHEVLLGCLDLLENFSYVYCESSFLELYHGQKLSKDVINWMSANGFDLIGIYNLSYSRQIGQSVQADFLFKNRSI
jgi:FkbM family methyltransferase